MFKKDRTYTYEEIEKILAEGQAKAMIVMDKEMAQARKESKNNEIDPLGRIAFTMQNMLAMSTLVGVLLKGEK